MKIYLSLVYIFHVSTKANIFQKLIAKIIFSQMLYSLIHLIYYTRQNSYRSCPFNMCALSMHVHVFTCIHPQTLETRNQATQTMNKDPN